MDTPPQPDPGLNHNQQPEDVEQLRQSEQRLQLALEATNLAVYEWDLVSDHLTANQRFKELLGIGSHEVILGAHVMEHIVHPKDRAHVDPELARAMDSGSTGRFAFEHRLSRPGPQGEPWVLSHGQVFFSGPETNRQPVRVFGTLQDINERKRREQEQHYLLQLADALRPLSDPKQIENTACRLLGEWLGVSSVYYCEIVEAEGIIRIDSQYLQAGGVPMPSQVSLDAYSWGAIVLGRGDAVVVADVYQSDLVPAELVAGMDVIGARSCLVVPLNKNGKWIGTLSVNDSEPRGWLAMQVEMTRETLERMWASAQRARAEVALRKSEEKYRTLFDTIAEGMTIFGTIQDDAGQLIDVRYQALNRAMQQQTGLDPRTILGRRLSEVLPQADRDRWMPLLAQVFASGEPVSFEEYVALIDRWYAVSFYPRSTDEIASFYRDITERKRQEQQQAFLADITKDLAEMETINDTIELLGEKIARQFKASWCNFAETTEGTEAGIVTYGWNAEDVAPVKGAHNMRDLWTEDQIAKNNAGELTIVHDTQTDPRVNAQNYAALNMGSFITVPLARDGVFKFMVGIPDTKPRQWRSDEVDLAKEVTHRIWNRLEKARAEEALQASQQRFESIANLVPDLLWESGPDGSTTWYNQRWLEYTGQRLEEAIGWGWTDALHPDDREGSVRAYRQAVLGGQPVRLEERIGGYDGAYRWFVVNASPLKDEQDRVVKMYGTATDIHESKRLEATLLEADRRKDEFLAMLAHELRNPMSTLRSGLNILELTTSEEMTRSTVAMMSRQTEHLVRMVDDLLDVSRISRGKIELKAERVNLVELVSQAAESVRALYQEQGKHLQVDLPTTPIELEGDATRLTQVVANLLTNGARYNHEQGQVWLSLSHRQNEAMLQVRDNGIGLADDQLSAIFELFVQVDNSTARSKGGLGLGLTLVKRLVEMHGGQVEAQSEGVGQGSTFRVHLPTLVAAAEPTPTATPQLINPAAAKLVLVIDDNADAGFTLGMLLKLKGYEAHTRTSGRAGIEAAEQLQPSAVLLDIGMPGLDGYETCRFIRQQAWGQDLVIIALTGYGQEEDRQRTKEAGFDGHLVKPVDLGALVTMLTDLLDRDQNNV